MALTMAPAAALDTFVEKLFSAEELRPGGGERVAALPSFLSKIRACEAHFGKRFGELERSVQDAVVLRRLQQMTNTLRLNPLWRERLGQAGLSAPPRDFDEWQRVPLSDRKTVSDLFMGPRHGLVVPLDHGGFEIVASGGTCGGPPVETVYALRELRDTYRVAGEFLGRHVYSRYLAGDEPKWVMTTLSDFQMWSSGTLVGGVLQAVPGVNYLGAGPVRGEVFQHVLSYRGPKALLALSHGVAVLPDLGAGSGDEARQSLRLAQYCGGALRHRDELELRTSYPNLEVLSYFSASQAEAIGVQLTPGGPLAAVPGLHLIEIVDADGRWVAEGEEGELVVTRLHAHEAPLPRLALGDRVIARPRLSGPELDTLQFEHVGRSDDRIQIGDALCSAPRAHAALSTALKAAGVLDLSAWAREVQFVNHRRAGVLRLIAAGDSAEMLAARLPGALGDDGLRRVFVEALAQSPFSGGPGDGGPGDGGPAIAATGYSFELHLVPRWSELIHRTHLGKVPLVRDTA